MRRHALGSPTATESPRTLGDLHSLLRTSPVRKLAENMRQAGTGAGGGSPEEGGRWVRSPGGPSCSRGRRWLLPRSWGSASEQPCAVSRRRALWSERNPELGEEVGGGGSGWLPERTSGPADLSSTLAGKNRTPPSAGSSGRPPPAPRRSSTAPPRSVKVARKVGRAPRRRGLKPSLAPPGSAALGGGGGRAARISRDAPTALPRRTAGSSCQLRAQEEEEEEGCLGSKAAAQ